MQFDISAMCREHAPEAVAALVRALANSKERVPAAIALLDRGFGRPKQTFEADAGGGLHALQLLAARAVSQEILERMEQRTIDGQAEKPRPALHDLLSMPPPLE